MTQDNNTNTLLATDIERAEAERARLSKAFGTLPEYGQVVSCYFPETERPNRPGIKPRPCLVVNASKPEGSNQWYLLVAYGTGARPDEAREGEYTVQDEDGLRAAGLHKPTRFVFTRVRALPFRYEFFRPNKDGTVILGELSPADKEAALLEAHKATRLRNRRNGRQQAPTSSPRQQPAAPPLRHQHQRRAQGEAVLER